jgi:hypothetical protein
MTIRAVEQKSAASRTTVFGVIGQVCEPLLVQISQFKSHIAKLNRVLSPDPYHFIRIARNPHSRAFKQPVRDRFDRTEGLIEDIGMALLENDELIDDFPNRRFVFWTELQLSIVAL